MRAYAEALVLAAISLIALWGAWLVPAASPGDTWAGIVPFSAGLALLFLSAILLVGAVRIPADGPQDETNPALPIETVVLLVVAILYQQSFRWFGYALPTAIAAPVTLYLFGVRSWVGLCASVVLCPLVFYIIFFELLGVFPPYGEVFDLLDWIRR